MILKAIKSTFEAIGMACFIFFVYGYIDGVFLIDNLFYSLLISVFVVWLTNKTMRYQGKHNLLDECPYCGTKCTFDGYSTKHDIICGMDVDTMGEFLMEWGKDCINGEEPKDVFKWLESKAEDETWTDEE